MTKPYEPKPGRHICKVRMYPNAAQILYDLLAEREPHQNISHVRMPTMDEHLAFIASNPYRGWYMICDDITAVGAIYLTWNNEVGIHIFKAHQRKGYGKWAWHWMHRTWGNSLKRKGQFMANINPANKESIAFFESLGFKFRQSTYQYQDLA